MPQTRILVTAAALMFTAFGLLGLLAPARTMDMIHLAPRGTTAFNEIRAMYGGVELGMAAFLLACLRDRWSLAAGLWLTTAVLAGAAAARTISMAVDGIPDTAYVGIWAAEVALAALCARTLRREGA